MKILFTQRYLLGVFIFLGLAFQVQAQVGIGTDNPDASSILDISSSDKGVLIPRMDSSTRSGISNPATGLLVYDTTTSSFWFFNGASWKNLSSPGAGGGSSPWYEQGTSDPATENTDNVYLLGNVAIGKNAGIPGVALDIDGSLRGANADGSATIGLNSIAFGEGSIASGDNSLSIGYLNESSGSFSTSIGGYTKASGEAATALGVQTQASGAASTAFGIGSMATEDAATAFGYGSQAIGEIATAFGYGSQAIGEIATAFGFETKAQGQNSLAAGFKSEAQTINSVAFGSETKAQGENAIAFGSKSNAMGKNSMVIGEGLEASSMSQVVIGNYNVRINGNPNSWVASDPLFVIGNGTSSLIGGANYKNALTVLKDGWIGIGTITKSGTEKLRVAGSIETAGANYPDYVFENYFDDFSEINSAYNFISLEETKEFIKNNRHLPGVTPITELERTDDGKYSFNMTELSIQSLEKIEELFLYVIEQDEKTKELNTQLEELKSEKQLLKEENEKLEMQLLEFNRRLEALENKE